jgi:hypothetical protein
MQAEAQEIQQQLETKSSFCESVISGASKKLKGYYAQSCWAYFPFSRKTPEKVQEWVEDQYADIGIEWKHIQKSRWSDEKIDGMSILSMTVEEIKEAGHSYGMARRLKSRLPKIQSASDMSTLIQIILLVAALLLTFAINLHTGIFTHDDLLEGDRRFFSVYDNVEGRPREDCTIVSDCGWLLSHGLQHNAVRAVFCFTFVLVAGMTIATSFHLSNYTEGEVSPSHYFILVSSLFGCYVLEIVGMYYLYSANMSAVDLQYPFYNRGDDIVHYGTYKETNGAEFMAYFSTTAIDAHGFYWHMRHSIFIVPPVIFGFHFIINVFL